MTVSYSEWIDFTFGLSGQTTPSLIRGDQIKGTAEEISEYCTRFLKTSPEVLRNIPHDNAKAALWELPGINGYLGLLSYDQLSFATRQALAEIQFNLFRDSFQIDDFDGAVFMWWEHLLGAEWQDSKPVGDDQQICEIIVSTLERIVSLPSEVCQRSGLHGLKEFSHTVEPGRTDSVFRHFRASALAVNGEVEKYATAAAEGDVP